MTTETDRDWIKPGVQVVVWHDTLNPQDATYKVVKVEKIAAKSFTVEGMTERVQFDTLATKRQGSTWSGWYWRVVPVGSPKHLELRKARQRVKAEADARADAERWMRNRDDLDNVTAVIESFAHLRDVLTTEH